MEGKYYTPFFVLLASMHEVHGIDELVHYFLLFISGYVRVLGNDLALLVDEVVERREGVFTNVICEGHLHTKMK